MRFQTDIFKRRLLLVRQLPHDPVGIRETADSAPGILDCGMLCFEDDTLFFQHFYILWPALAEGNMMDPLRIAIGRARGFYPTFKEHRKKKQQAQ